MTLLCYDRTAFSTSKRPYTLACLLRLILEVFLETATLSNSGASSHRVWRNRPSNAQQRQYQGHWIQGVFTFPDVLENR